MAAHLGISSTLLASVSLESDTQRQPTLPPAVRQTAKAMKC